MTQETGKQVFISYSRRNEYFAKQLDCDLRRMGLSPWRDKRSTEVNSIWRAEITKSIQQSDVFLLLLSPDAAESKYVQLEWEVACECLPADRMAILKICRFASGTNTESNWVTDLNERQNIGFVGDYWNDHDDKAGFRKLTVWLGQARIRSSTELLSDDSIAVADLVTEFRDNAGRSWPISRGDDRLQFVALPLLFMNAPQALTYPVASHLGTMNPLRIYNLQRGPVRGSETYRCVYRTNQS